MSNLTSDPITVLPANEVAWRQLRDVFGDRGQGARCFCQRYKLEPGAAFKHNPASFRADRLRQQAGCGDRRASRTSGLVAVLGETPVGWCAVEPRPAYPGLLRVYRVPWIGRQEDKDDDRVWAVTCLFTRAGYRKRRVSYALAAAAVEFARARGARALEAYPMVAAPGQDITWGELSVGTESVFLAAGMKQISQPTPRRLIMRIDFQASEVGSGVPPS